MLKLSHWVGGNFLHLTFCHQRYSWQEKSGPRKPDPASDKDRTVYASFGSASADASAAAAAFDILVVFGLADVFVSADTSLTAFGLAGAFGFAGVFFFSAAAADFIRFPEP